MNIDNKKHVTSFLNFHHPLGYPFSSLGHTCGIIDGSVQNSWQSSNCNKKLGYICYSKGDLAAPTEGNKKSYFLKV